MKNKYFIRILSLVLCLLCAFSGVMVSGCKKEDEKVVNLNHQRNVTETNEWFIKEAKSDYVILISSDADNNEITASRELQTLFREATGLTLNIITDEGVTFSKQSKFLSIGENVASKSAEIVTEKSKLKEQGFYIKTVGNSIFMIGATSYGSLYAVYEFLSIEFNFEHFFTDVYDIERNVTDAKLKNYDVTEIPDIDIMTVPNVGYIQYNSQNANRMRVVPISTWSIPQNNYNNVHNAFQILPPDKFLSEHPSWYTTSNAQEIDNGQLCFSAHTNLLDANADRTEYNAFVNEILKVIQSGVKKSTAEIFTISQRDNKGFCSCDNCNEISRYYGAKSSLLVLLCNKLSDLMNEWFETPDGLPYKRDLKILFLAYQDVENAPAVYNSDTKKYEPTHEDMKCRPNVGVQMASLSIYNTYDFTHEVNKERKENILAWGALTNKFTFWTYSVNFQNYLVPYDSFVIKKDLYKLLAESGTMVLNDQGQTQNIGTCTSWDNLKSYLETKLRWNTDADLTALTKRYFEVCYKSASDKMYNLYLQYRAHSEDIKAKYEEGYYEGAINQGAIGDIFGGLESTLLWEKPMLVSWYNQYQQALKDLDAIKESDANAYTLAYKMVCGEMISPLYMLIKLYGNTYSPETLNQMKKEFKNYCTISCINYYKDSTATGGIENLYKELGIE